METPASRATSRIVAIAVNGYSAGGPVSMPCANVAPMLPMDHYLEARRARLAAAWDLRDDVVLLLAGEPVPVPGGADQTHPFLAHAEYFWLTDRETPGGVLAFDPKEG